MSPVVPRPGRPGAPAVPLLLDGGVATHLASIGGRLDPSLWSGIALLEDEARGRQVHRDYAAAGADILGTLTYQCSATALARRGLEREERSALYRRSVQWCRDAFASLPSADRGGRPVGAGMVALSIGPYGASLADGSEYRGGYTVGRAALRRHHEATLDAAAGCGADVLLLETVPDVREVEELLAATAELELPVWLSLSVADGARLADGSPLSGILPLLESSPPAALGVNCCAPAVATAALRVLAGAGLPLLVYPNTGERYARGEWSGRPQGPGDELDEWLGMGVAVVGGCCRTTPGDIRELRRRLDGIASGAAGTETGPAPEAGDRAR